MIDTLYHNEGSFLRNFAQAVNFMFTWRMYIEIILQYKQDLMSKQFTLKLLFTYRLLF